MRGGLGGGMSRSTLFRLYPVWRQGLAISVMVWLAGTPASAAEESTEITAVFATVTNGYQRSLLPNGTYKPETYAFGEGGFTGIPLGDESINRESFLKIARTIAPVLERIGYVNSHDPAKTDLLIMVYWGTTGTDARSTGGYSVGSAPIPPPPPPPPVIVTGNGRVVVVTTPPPPAQPTSSPEQNAFDAIAGAQNRQRDRDNLRNAQLLGYDEELHRASTRPESRRYLDLVDEVEDTRYFIVLRAYDFKQMWKEKQRKALWEVRYSIRAHGHLFGDALVAMTDMASSYFGQKSKGLVRREVPVGRVEMGELIFRDAPEATDKK